MLHEKQAREQHLKQPGIAATRAVHQYGGWQTVRSQRTVGWSGCVVLKSSIGFHDAFMSRQVMTTGPQTRAIVLAAGMGTRMRSDQPKVMHRIAGIPLVCHVVNSLETIGCEAITVITGEDSGEIADLVAPHDTAVQRERLGTGHAVAAARHVFGNHEGTVLVLFGADPLIEPPTLRRLVERRQASDNPAVVALGFRPDEAGMYGRLVTDHCGTLSAIVEAHDATPEQQAIGLCNAGAMAIDAARICPLIDALGNDNAKGEYYLTDIIGIARQAGHVCAIVEVDSEEIIGIDTRSDLARAEAIIQRRLRARALEGGASLVDPASLFLSADTRIGRDVTIEPHVFIGPGVEIGDGVLIRAFCHIEQTRIAARTTIGPFARLRGDTVVGEECRVGNFVEMKNAALGDGAKVSHLSYLGDADVGLHANIGAGTIICNYDGFRKNRTNIGEGAFVGSGSMLIAPISVGAGSIIGAGSTINRDVAADALAVARANQRNLAGGATRLRIRRKKSKMGG